MALYNSESLPVLSPYHKNKKSQIRIRYSKRNNRTRENPDAARNQAIVVLLSVSSLLDYIRGI